jgi:hypothetical protein
VLALAVRTFSLRSKMLATIQLDAQTNGSSDMRTMDEPTHARDRWVSEYAIPSRTLYLEAEPVWRRVQQSATTNGWQSSIVHSNGKHHPFRSCTCSSVQSVRSPDSTRARRNPSRRPARRASPSRLSASHALPGGRSTIVPRRCEVASIVASKAPVSPLARRLRTEITHVANRARRNSQGSIGKRTAGTIAIPVWRGRYFDHISGSDVHRKESGKTLRSICQEKLPFNLN